MDGSLKNTFSIIQSSEDQQQEVHRRLQEYNRPFFKDERDFSFHIERDGQIVAGIVAGSTYQTLEVDFLFVGERFRGQGLGSLLLRTAEDRARAAGIRHVLLNTYSFQAPGFYRKEGYTELFRIDNCLGPHSQFFFWKDLKDSDDHEGSKVFQP